DGTKELIDEADYVTSDLAHDGVAKALDKFI
ncbi:MAG: hypothetical protein UT63_C0019G0031, partial [Candidatus Gottesmanbacteria bacterium GW2011_GWC2_39_8]